MKRFLILLTGLLLSLHLLSQDSAAFRHWTGNTALVVPRHRLELGLFTLSHYGISDRVELSAHPLMVFLLPQIKVKVTWGHPGGFYLATEHGILYPTLFMRLVARKGTGGLISPEFEIPQMIALYNRFIASYSPFNRSLVSAWGGVAVSWKSGPLNPASTIDMPLIYPRLAVFYNQPEFDAGADFRGRFHPRFGWLFSVENFLVCGTKQNYFLENKGVLAYTSKKENLRVEAGYKLCFGRYPAGPQWHLLPVVEMVLGFGR